MPTKLSQPLYLPMSQAEMRQCQWEQLDILFVTGDAYVDHPSFAAAILGRWLVSQGYRVGIVAQPRWDNPSDIQAMGEPRLFTCVSAGALDSMLAHYTAFRKLRHDDAFTPGGQHGKRPNRAVIAYTNLVRQAFPGKPVIIGGIEASLRRLSHYDFWTNSIRRSVLLDSKANVLVYGMGEAAIAQLAKQAELVLSKPEAHLPFPTQPVLGTVVATSQPPEDPQALELPSHEQIISEPFELMRATLAAEQLVHQAATTAWQKCGDRVVVVYPPAPVLSGPQLDAIYNLPFAKAAHPSYTQPIPAVQMIMSSINTHRGCAGGCSFCSLALHQGRRLASRSQASIMREVSVLAKHQNFHGAISDVGGPSANMWQARCRLNVGNCQRSSCLFPNICPNFEHQQHQYVSLLRQIAAQPGIKHLRVSSGIRYDLALEDGQAVKAYVGEFTGGQLKIAPEHICPEVLALMRKPGGSKFEKFVAAFERYSQAAGKQQYVIPYLISAFPGCTDKHMRELAEWLAKRNWTPQQVQCFVPTPGTVATAMFYCEKDTERNPIFVAKTDAQRLKQHAQIAPQWGNKSARGASEQPSGHPSQSRQGQSSGRPGKSGRTGRSGHGHAASQPRPSQRRERRR